MENISIDDQLYFDYDNNIETLNILIKIKPFIEDYNKEFFEEINDKVEDLNDVNMIEKLISTYKETESKRLFNYMKNGLEEYKQFIFNSINHDLELFKTIQNQFDAWILKNQLNEHDKIDFLWQSPLSVKIEDYIESNEDIIERWLTLYDSGKTIHFFMEEAKNKGFNPILSINKPHRSYEAFLMIKCSCGQPEEYEVDGINIENDLNIDNNKNIKYRICSLCDKKKDIIKFNDGTGSSRKLCNSCRGKEYRVIQKEKKLHININNSDIKYKICIRCNIEQDIVKFKHSTNRFRNICNPCRSKRDYKKRKERKEITKNYIE